MSCGLRGEVGFVAEWRFHVIVLAAVAALACIVGLAVKCQLDDAQEEVRRLKGRTSAPAAGGCPRKCDPPTESLDYNVVGGPTCGCFVRCKEHADCPEGYRCFGRGPMEHLADHGPFGGCVKGERVEGDPTHDFDAFRRQPERERDKARDGPPASP